MIETRAAMLYVVDDLFGAHRRSFVVMPGTPIAAAVAENYPGDWPEIPPPLTIIRNGQRVEDAFDAIEPGDVVTVYPTMNEPVSIGATIASAVGATGVVASVIAFAVNMLVIAALSYAASRLLGPGSPRLGKGESGSSTYRWDGISTEYVGMGAAIPVVYGEHDTGGVVISYAIDSDRVVGSSTDAHKSVLRMLVAISEGEVESIAGFTEDVDNVSAETIDDELLEINGTPANKWGGGVRVSVRLGRVDQSSMEEMNDERTTYPWGVTLSGKGDDSVYTTKREVDAVRVGILFPKGLVWISDEGDYKRTNCVVLVRFREDVTGSAWSDWRRVAVFGQTTSPFTHDVTIKFPARARYVIEAQRESVASADKMILTASKLDTVQEIAFRRFTYPGLAYIGLEIRAIDGLSGGRPRVRVRVRGRKVRVWDGVDATNPTFAATYSRDPYWIAFDALTNTHYGLGDAVRNLEVDLEEFEDGASHAAETIKTGDRTTLKSAALSTDAEIRVVSRDGFEVGDDVVVWSGGTEVTRRIVEVRDGDSANPKFRLSSALGVAFASGAAVDRAEPRYLFDRIFDGNESPWDAVETILATARTRIVKTGNLVRLVRSVPRDPVMVANEGNGADVFAVTYASDRQQPNVLAVQFANALTQYERDVVYVPASEARLDDVSDATYYEREGVRVFDESAWGITRETQARRHGAFRLRQMRNGSGRSFSLSLPLEAVVADVGERIEIAHRVIVPGGAVNGRVAEAVSAGGATVKLDREVTISGGTTYVVTLRSGDTSIVTRTITTGAGTYAAGTALAISGTWPATIAKGAPYAFGPSGEETVPAEVVGFAQREDLRIDIMATEYIEANLVD